MARKPSIPKGTRDFAPEVMVRRNFIFDTIRAAFQLYGYQPLETPSMEKSETLLGKYGDEGDRLIFKILNSGDYLSKANFSAEISSKTLAPKISEKALRYDLTVPFARYVAQNQGEITFPFKRYQMQPVWRADRPQKGRFREFYQCDADVVGSESLLNELELLQLCDAVFANLGFSAIDLRINNRKVLMGLAEAIGATDQFSAIMVAMDKLDKIGIIKVQDEMRANGVPKKAVFKIEEVFSINGSNIEKINNIEKIIGATESGKKGVEELRFLLDRLSQLDLRVANLVFDPTLARGLDYYTGTIYEVGVPNVGVGSVGGGGRYDDLTAIFGVNDLSGVGISFGVDRIYLAMKEFNLFPTITSASTQVMFVNFGEEEADYCLPLLQKLRAANVNTELFPSAEKMKKQMNYANKKAIAYVVLVGPDEMATNTLSVKNMITGEQEKMTLDQFIEKLN